MADTNNTLRVLMVALMQHPEVRAAMDKVFEDVVLYGNVRPETEEAVLAAVRQAVPMDGLLERGATSSQSLPYKGGT